MDKDLVEYLVIYYSELLSGKEKLLIKHAKSHLKLSPETLGEFMKEINWVDNLTDTSIFFTDDPLRITNENFDLIIAKNILEKHKDKIFLNFCPVCGRLTRTPRAKQCRNGHDWHNVPIL